jgi:hypothetical protein
MLLTLALVAAACGADVSGPSEVCQHYAELAEQYGLILAKDGSDVTRCVKDEERRRRKLGEAAYAPYASCLLATRNLVEYMACDPAPR